MRALETLATMNFFYYNDINAGLLARAEKEIEAGHNPAQVIANVEAHVWQHAPILGVDEQNIMSSTVDHYRNNGWDLNEAERVAEEEIKAEKRRETEEYARAERAFKKYAAKGAVALVKAYQSGALYTAMFG